MVPILVVGPKVWPFPPQSLLHPHQCCTMILRLDCSTLWHELDMDNTLEIKKNQSSSSSIDPSVGEPFGVHSG